MIAGWSGLTKAKDRGALLINRAPTSRYLPVLAGGVCLLILLMGLVYFGVRMGAAAEGDIKTGVLWWQWLWSGQLFDRLDFSNYQYLVFYLIIGGGVSLLGHSFLWVFVLLNAILFSAMVWLGFRFWARVGEASGLLMMGLGLLLFLGLPDVPLWVYYIFYDVIFLFAVGLYWYFLAGAVIDRRIRSWLIAWLVALCSLVVHPRGILLVLFLIGAGVYLAIGRRLKRPGLTLVVTLGLMGLLAIGGWPALVFLHNDVVPPAVARWYAMGVVVLNRPETYLSGPSSYWDYVWITLQRIGYFLVPLRAGYSIGHNIIGVIYALFLAFFCLRGWRWLWGLNERSRGLASLLVLFCCAFTLFHGMMVVDYDWRYQMPAMVPAWLLAGFGIPTLLRGRLTPREPEVYRHGSK
ncbi:MAG: hypothetical protein KJ621_16180 [Proteobacteria bacterium]|nr:hypothetical protein [Pseudomonadota bacterium]MBU1741279.1 hypothetical protein [Pseudomonadota bacterium]